MDFISLIKKLQRPEGKVDVVLDTDTYNEADDQFALAYLLSYGEKLTTKAIYAAPFFNHKCESPKEGMEMSFSEIHNLLHLMGREDMAPFVYRGSEGYLPDEETPVESPAAEHLCELAMEYSPDQPLYVIAIGAVTNIASAILKKPEIIDRIVLIWLGGNALPWPKCNDFNMRQDVASARVVFGCKVPLIHVPPMGAADRFTISEAELLYWLKGKNALCDYLVQYLVDDMRKWSGRPWNRIIWDVTAVAWLTGDFTMTRIVPSPIPEYDCHFAIDETRHPICQMYYVNRDELVRDLFERLVRF